MSAARTPAHRRSITVEVVDLPEVFEVHAHLTDERPWAEGTEHVYLVHDLGLTLRVRRSDLVITAAKATMDRFPHAECPGIAPSFEGLVGLSVARGYTKAVQERFGRVKGCAHLVVLATAVAPVVIQAIPSSASREAGTSGIARSISGEPTWLTGTCHIWEPEQGPGPTKVALGWRPGRGDYPAPSVEQVQRELAQGGEEA